MVVARCAGRLERFLDRLGLSVQEAARRIPGRGGGVHRSTLSRWLSPSDPARPRPEHLLGLVDRLVGEGRIPASARSAWTEAALGVLSVDLVSDQAWARELDALGAAPAPPAPVVLVAPGLPGQSLPEDADRRFLEAAQAACGLSTAQALAALDRLVGPDVTLQSSFELRAGSEGSLVFHPRDQRFELRTRSGRSRSFHVTATGASRWMQEVGDGA